MNEHMMALQAQREKGFQNIAQLEQQQEAPVFSYDNYELFLNQKEQLDDDIKENLISDIKLGIGDPSMLKDIRRNNVISNAPEDSRAELSSMTRRKVNSTRQSSVKAASKANVANYSADSLLYKNDLEKYQKQNPNGFNGQNLDWKAELNQVGVEKERAKKVTIGSDDYKQLHMFSQSYTYSRRSSIDILDIKGKIAKWDFILQQNADGMLQANKDQQRKLARLKKVSAAAKLALAAELRVNGINPETEELIKIGSAEQVALPSFEELSERRDKAALKYQDALIIDYSTEIPEEEINHLNEFTSQEWFREKQSQVKADWMRKDHAAHPEQAALSFSISNADMSNDFKDLKDLIAANPQNYAAYKDIIDTEYSKILSYLSQAQDNMVMTHIIDKLPKDNPDRDNFMQIISAMDIASNLKQLVDNSRGIIKHLIKGGVADPTGLFAKQIEERYNVVTPFREAYKERRELFTEEKNKAASDIFRSYKLAGELNVGINRLKGMDGEVEVRRVYNDVSEISKIIFDDLPTDSEQYIQMIRKLQSLYERLVAHCEEVHNLKVTNPEMQYAKDRVEYIWGAAKEESKSITSQTTNLLSRVVKHVIPATELLYAARTVNIDVTGVELKRFGGQVSEVYRIEPENAYFKCEEKSLQPEEMVLSLEKTHPNATADCRMLLPLIKRSFTEPCFMEEFSSLLNQYIVCGKLAALGRAMSETDAFEHLTAIPQFMTLYQNRDSIIYSEAQKIAHYLDCEGVRQKSHRIDIGRDMAMRNVATARVAKLLGAGNLVTDATMSSLKRDGQVAHRGVLMETAEGVELPSLEKKMVNGETVNQKVTLSQAVKLQLCDLNVLDNICGQTDRHRTNFKVQYEQVGDVFRVTQLKGIDNDFAFGKRSGKQLLSTDSNRTDVSNTMHIDQLTVISNSMYQNVMSLDKTILEYTLGDLLDKEEMEALFDRLSTVQQVLAARYNAKALVLASNEQSWDEKVDKSFRSMNSEMIKTVNPKLFKSPQE